MSYKKTLTHTSVMSRYRNKLTTFIYYRGKNQEKEVPLKHNSKTVRKRSEVLNDDKKVNDKFV